MSGRQLRWFAIAVLVLSSGLNYLDRMLLNVLMPTLQREFGVGGTEMGLVIGAFSLTYAVSSPVMGFLVDRVGLRVGASAVVGFWSLAGLLTGLTSTLGSLTACRALLGVAESGGIPVTAKGAGVYLEPRDRALGSAVSQFGLTIGTVAAPLMAEWLSPRFGWRSVFVVAGLLGFLWIPLWLWTSSRIPAARVASDPVGVDAGTMLRDRRFQAVVVANILAMTVYSLWTNWTTPFFVRAYGLTQAEANLRYVWVPPLFATLGGLFGGWLAQRLIAAGADLVDTRLRIAIGAGLFSAATMVAPAAGHPALATAAIAVSLFATTCLSVNYYSIPLDLFGAGRAAFAVSFLTGVFGLMQAFLSPLIGRWSDTIGWQPVCTLVAFMPLLSALLLKGAFRRS